MEQTIVVWSPLGIALMAAALVVLALIAVAAASFATYAARRAKDSAIWATVNKLWGYAQAAVAHGEAELRPKIAKKLEDGRLTPEEMKELKGEVITVFREMAGAELAKLQKSMGMDDGPFSLFISGLIERAVSLLKPTPIIPIAAVSTVVVSDQAPTPPVSPKSLERAAAPKPSSPPNPSKPRS